jgi:putative DNA-invertase from lambdoid prophage Rac
MAVYGYCRVSTMRQADEGVSLEVQRRQIRGYCDMHSFEITDVVIEEGISGSTPISQRPAGGLLFAKLQAGDTVIASKLDRLFRSALDALTVVENLKSRGVRLHLLDLGGDIAANGLSKLFLTVAAAFAEAERDRIRERVAQVKADQKGQGRFLGGSLPFGYATMDGKLVPKPCEQETIERIKLLKAQGMSLRAISATVKAYGHNLSHTAIARVLRDNV